MLPRARVADPPSCAATCPSPSQPCTRCTLTCPPSLESDHPRAIHAKTMSDSFIYGYSNGVVLYNTIACNSYKLAKKLIKGRLCMLELDIQPSK